MIISNGSNKWRLKCLLANLLIPTSNYAFHIFPYIGYVSLRQSLIESRRQNNPKSIYMFKYTYMQRPKIFLVAIYRSNARGICFFAAVEVVQNWVSKLYNKLFAVQQSLKNFDHACFSLYHAQALADRL